MNKAKIVRKEGNYQIFWEEKLLKEVDNSLLVRGVYALASSQTKEELEEKLLDLQVKKGKALAVYWLSRRGVFQKELVEKLKGKGFPDEAIEKTVAFCQKIGALNDQKLAEEWINKELRKGRGALSAFYKMRQWVEKEQLTVDWENLSSLEIKAIEKVCEKKRISLPVESWKERQKLFASLLKKGFAKESIEEVLKQS